MKKWEYIPETGWIQPTESGDIYKIARVSEEINPEWQHERGRLLASAPALYAALEACCTSIPDVDITKHRERIAEINGIARAALAQASGEGVKP